MGGTEAIEHKRKLEARQQILEVRASQIRLLNLHEQKELDLIRSEIAKLLQVDKRPTAVVSEPVGTKQGPESHEYADWIAQSPSPGHILLIEDDPGTSALLDYVLQHHRFDVTHFSDGKLARNWILANQPPDLISLDLMLPYHDGLELLSLIRQQPGWEKVPIVMLSSKSDAPSLQRALDLGANEFLHKPFQPDVYLARIRRLLAEP